MHGVSFIVFTFFSILQFLWTLYYPINCSLPLLTPFPNRCESQPSIFLNILYYFLPLIIVNLLLHPCLSSLCSLSLIPISLLSTPNLPSGGTCPSVPHPSILYHPIPASFLYSCAAAPSRAPQDAPRTVGGCCVSWTVQLYSTLSSGGTRQWGGPQMTLSDTPGWSQ